MDIELKKEEKPISKNFDFIDGIRCIAMISIVMEHSISIDVYRPKDTLSVIILCSWIQLIKFGTVCFFLLAGFLIGEKFTTYTPLQYFKRRIGTTFLPWLFWSVVFLILLCFDDLIKAVKYNGGHFGANYGDVFLEHLKGVYLFSNFWFIPNFLCCIAILLLFRKYLYTNILGAFLLLISLLYTANIYFVWIEPRHSVAIFAFVFYLWLGAQLNKNFAKFQNFVNKLSYPVIAVALILTFVLGVYEELYLKSVNSVDPYNSLRLTNLIYSLWCFMLFFKIKEIKLVKLLKPRETTFGMYLIHFILVACLLPMLFPSLKFDVSHLTLAQMLIYQLGRFLIVYILTWFIVVGISKTKAKWLLGR